MKTLDIPYLRLNNQQLIKTEFQQPEEVVSFLGAVQAQEYPSAKWALGLRMKQATDNAIEQAFTEGRILRTHIMRPTWHFVAPPDIRWMQKLTSPRVKALNAFMDRKLEIDEATFRRSHQAITKALQGGKQLTRAELASALEKAGVQTKNGQRLAYLVMRAELDCIICSGARRGKQFTYALLEERVPPAKDLDRDQALAELVKRYFLTRGPATLQDFTWWSGLTMADARLGIEMVKSQFLSETRNGQTYWFSDTRPPAKKKAPVAYLLPSFDEYFIGLRDRSAILEVVRKAGIKEDNPSFMANVIVLEGQLVGGWKRTVKKDKVLVELSPITKLAVAEKQAIDEAAQRYGEFLGLEVVLTG